MGTTVEAPPPRDYPQEMRETLGTQIELAPDLYAAEASEEYGQPAYTTLGLRTLARAMTGRGTDEKGVLSLYGEDIVPSLSATEQAAARSQREADLADVESLGGRATDALLGADPRKQALSNMLAQQAQDELAQGATLDPSLRREVQQAYRNAATARGMAYSPSSAAEEAYFTGLQAEQLRRNRQQFAMQALGQRQQLTGDPFLSILGRPAQSFAAAPGFGQQGYALGQTGARMYSPESQYAADLHMGNYQGQLAARTASAQARSGIIGGIAQGLGAIGGGWARSW